ncbi:5749_t:CDS:2, partial [Dentiscutata heterogama]
QLKEDTLADLEKFANEGLRTLCVAYRVIPEEEYNVWAQSYAEASSSINDREEKVEKACELIEHSLTLMGGTAIEDRLQEGVPECIATLSTAGIKIWVLTGDKTETAINIGFSCNLLQKDMLLIIINASDKQSTLYQLKEAMDKFFGPNVEACNKSSKHALVIDGETLKYALDQSLKHLLLDIGKRCNSVICCRVSPLQKAKVVALVKEGLSVMTLSIGDGANDVSMIQEANVGIGIAGEEGRQAVMAADYAFAQFRFLDKLLLVHGRWSYIRIAEMISCFFYKNIVWTIAMFWYQIWAGFTAQYLYDYTYILLYNLAFTAVPVMYLGAFDQDVDAKTSLDNPQLYKRGILQRDFTKSKFWLYVLDSFYQSAICFFIPFGVFQNGSSHANGLQNNGLSDLGTMVAGAVVVTTNLYVGLNTMNWSWLCFVVIGLSILSFYAWVEFYSLWYIGFFRMDLILYTEIDFWLTVLLCAVFSLLPRYAVKYIHKTYWPSDMDIIREQVHESKKGKKKKRESGEQFTDISLNSDDDSNHTMVVDMHDNTNMHNVHNDNSFADITLDVSTKPRSMSKLPKLPRITSIKKTRKDSIRSMEQLFHMDSGKRQSFTGFAFSGEESSFEGFRQSIYQPKQQCTTGQRSNTFTSSSNNDKKKSLMSVFRNRTMPTTLFRRWSPNPSRATSPNRSNNDENVRRRGNSSNEEVELTIIPPS